MALQRSDQVSTALITRHKPHKEHRGRPSGQHATEWQTWVTIIIICATDSTVSNIGAPRYQVASKATWMTESTLPSGISNSNDGLNATNGTGAIEWHRANYH